MDGEFLLDLYTIKFVIGWEMCTDQIIVTSNENYIIDSGIWYNNVTNQYNDELVKHHYKLKEANEELVLDPTTNTICIAERKSNQYIDEYMENMETHIQKGYDSFGATQTHFVSDPCSSKDTSFSEELTNENNQRSHCVPTFTSPYFDQIHYDRYHRQEHYIRQEPGVLTSKYQPHPEGIRGTERNEGSNNLVELMDDMVLI